MTGQRGAETKPRDNGWRPCGARWVWFQNGVKVCYVGEVLRLELERFCGDRGIALAKVRSGRRRLRVIRLGLTGACATSIVGD